MFLTLLVACGPDLPEGWEDAVPVARLDQTACAGNPYEDHDERVEVDFDAVPVHIDYLEAHFRCEQEVEAFARIGGDRLDLLVQPVDMTPRVVPDCDCLFDVALDVDEFDGTPATVGLYRRWDALNEPNPVVEIGVVTP